MPWASKKCLHLRVGLCKCIQIYWLRVVHRKIATLRINFLLRIKLRSILISECSLELARLGLERKWLHDSSNIGLQLCRHTAFGHQFFLKLLLPSPFHAIADFIHARNVVYLIDILILLESFLNHLWVINYGIKRHFLLSSLHLIILLCLLALLDEPALVFFGVEV